MHSFHFLCKKRICGKEFSSKVALVKCGLCHQLPHYRCTLCGLGFHFQYQLKDHSSTHTPIFRLNADTQGAVGFTKVNQNTKGIIKYILQNFRNIHVPHVGKVAPPKRT